MNSLVAMIASIPLGILLGFGFIFFLMMSLREARSDEIPLAPEKTEVKISSRSLKDVIGHYQGHDIYKTLRLEDGRVFAFESIAVEKTPGSGTYFADKPNTTYIVVEKCLLYREVSRVKPK